MFKQIPGFPHYLIYKNGQIYSKYKNKFLKPRINNRGYLCVELHKNKKIHYKMIHILLLETFISKRPDNMIGCHKDDNKLNNSLRNLYWGTYRQNLIDAFLNGKRKGNYPKLSKPKSKRVYLNDLQKRIIKKYPKHYGCNKYLAYIFGVSFKTIEFYRNRHDSH